MECFSLALRDSDIEVLNRKVSMVNGLACRGAFIYFDRHSLIMYLIDFSASTNWTFTTCQFSPASARRGAFIHFERHSLIICFRPHRIHSLDLHDTPMPSSPVRTLLTEKTPLKHPGHQSLPLWTLIPPQSSERHQTHSKTCGGSKPAAVPAGDEQEGFIFRRKRARH
jgi:hypothetical protein